jgi:gluconate 2-dehydrogenase gamma chain
MTQPLSDSIGRREALRRAALLLGGALSAPTIAGVLAGCESPRSAEGAWRPRALDSDQAELVATIAEHILPETDTPGARAAGVHRFIDSMLAEYYPAAERQAFISGLADVEARAQRLAGRLFLRCSPEQQRAILEELDREALAPPTSSAAPDAGRETERGEAASPPASMTKGDTAHQPQAPRTASFFRTFKELTVVGYYTSEIGATWELRYVQVPGRFEGCVPFERVGRTWAV